MAEDDNEEYLPILGKKIKEYFSIKDKQRKEDTKNGIIHIGNITNGCTRASMILEKYGDQIDYSIWDYTDFMDGLGSEDIIVKVLNHGGEKDGDYQKDIRFDVFTGHPDWIDISSFSGDEVIFELKSSKKIKPFILSDSTIQNYVRQVVYYMILENVEKGRILVRYHLPMFPEYVGKELDESTGVEESIYKLNYHRDTGQFPFYTIKITIPLQAPIRERLKKSLIEIIKPLYLEGDIEKIPILDDKPTNWKCQRYCKVKDFCDKIPDKQTDPMIRYVMLNKHIDNSINRVRKFGKRKDKNVDIS